MYRLKLIFLALLASLALAWIPLEKPAVQAGAARALQLDPPTEVATGFDGKSNGMLSPAEFEADQKAFDTLETAEDGVGPVFNANSCGECHGNPVSGGGSQIAELRAGHFDGTTFIDHPGGSLIHSRAIDPKIQERVLDGNEVRTLRLSLSILGDGFIEVIDDFVLMTIARDQPAKSGGKIAGQVIYVPVLEAPGVTRIGRFGWKNQHASLLSFSADAYTNEMGITTPLSPVENTSNGRSVAKFDLLEDPDEGDNDDLEAFTRFMRSTKAPSRDTELAASSEAQSGEQLFTEIGCAICHVPTFTTLPAGFTINGGTFTIPPALGNKIIHPFGDFLLHDIGTGDGIVQNGGPETRNKVRTTPLWGLRTRNRLMHDGASLTTDEAVRRHSGEAEAVTARYRALSKKQRRHIQTFLNSL